MFRDARLPSAEAATVCSAVSATSCIDWEMSCRLAACSPTPAEMSWKARTTSCAIVPVEAASFRISDADLRSTST